MNTLVNKYYCFVLFLALYVRGTMFGHLTRFDSVLSNIIEGKTEGKREIERETGEDLDEAV